MTKKNILLDMDGVLSDFLTGALKVLDAKYGAAGPGDPVELYVKSHAQFEITNYYGITDEEFWAAIANTPNFWYDLPALPWARELLGVIRSFGDVTICSAPGNDITCCTQKQAWLRDVLDVDYRDVVLCNKKYLLANPDVLLIDDYIKNVDTFRVAGGRAVLVPSNWNTLDLTLEKVLSPILQYGI